MSIGFKVWGSSSLLVPRLCRYQLRAGKGSRSIPQRKASVSCCRLAQLIDSAGALAFYRRAHARAPLSLGFRV